MTTAFFRLLLRLLIPLAACSFASAQGPLRDSVIQFRVEALGTAGETRVNVAVAVQVTPEGILLTTATPFAQAGASTRVKISAMSGESLKFIRTLELLLVDQQANIAVLRATGASRRSSSIDFRSGQTNLEPGRGYSTVKFVASDVGSRFPHIVDLSLVSPNTLLPIELAELDIGAPVISSNGELVGLLSSANRDGSFGVLPVSVDSIPALAYAAIFGIARIPADVGYARSSLVVPISQMQDTHIAGITLREYQRRIEAPTGSKISSASISITSSNKLRDSPRIQISPDSRSAIVSYSLESGPFWDRWRGWLSGEVQLTLSADR